MRAGLYTPTVTDFDAVFADAVRARGGSLNDIHIYSRKRGGSLFGVLACVLKQSVPFLRSVILPEFGGVVKNVTEDVSNNIPFKSSLKQNLTSSAKNIGKRIVRGGGARGGGRRRRRGRVSGVKRLKRARASQNKTVKTRKKAGKRSSSKKSQTRRKNKKKCHPNMKNDIFNSDMYSHF